MIFCPHQVRQRRFDSASTAAAEAQTHAAALGGSPGHSSATAEGYSHARAASAAAAPFGGRATLARPSSSACSLPTLDAEEQSIALQDLEKAMAMKEQADKWVLDGCGWEALD